MPKSQDRFDELKISGKLPSPTGVAVKILELTQQDQVTIAEIAQVLKSDPVLAGKVLRMVNSARLGLQEPIVDLSYGVCVLGLRTVRQLVLAFSVVASSPRGGCAGFDYDKFWLQSLATALAGQALSRKQKIAAPEEAYTYGLLSQIGRLALATVYPEEYSAVLQASPAESGSRLAEAEQAAFGIDHNQLSAAMVTDWGLSAESANAILHCEGWQQDELDETSDSWALTQLLHFASCLAQTWLAQGMQREQLLATLLERASQLGLSSEEVICLADDVTETWPDWCALLELNSTDIAPLQQTMDHMKSTTHDEPPGTAADKQTWQPSPLRILIVDDDPMCLRYMEKHLAADLYQLTTAESGHEAIRLAMDVNPHMIITDWMMEEMNGLEFCRTIRQCELGRQAYIIIVTGQDDKGRLTEAFRAGCDDYLTKPVNPQELRARIRAAERVIRLQQELHREKDEVERFAAELSVGKRKLEKVAVTDALTGLPNRRFAVDQLQQAWEAAGRRRQPLACMLIDVDHFKKVNDTHGHPTGDVVLRQTAAALSESIRRRDVLCRFGGEEFVVICEDTDLPSALLAAERVRQVVAENMIQSGSFSQCVTVSIGVAVRGESMNHFECLLQRADDVLYDAKESGRNCVRFRAGHNPSAGGAHECMSSASDGNAGRTLAQQST